MIEDWGMYTLWVYDSSDELDKGNVASSSSIMKRSSSNFILLIEDLWVLFYQALQESQVTLFSQLDGNIKWENTRRVTMWEKIPVDTCWW